MELETLEQRFHRAVERHRDWAGDHQDSVAAYLRFARGRLEEGRAVAGLLRARLGEGRLRVLDLGAGNGGVSLGLAAAGSGFEVTALDLVLNPVLRELRGAAAPSRVRQTLGRGEELPCRDGAFDAVLCLDSFEHFRQPETIGREILRVLRPGGACVLSTPARVKYLLRPDPHHGVRGLLLLPDPLQRLLVNRWLGRRPPYDVHHTYWHLGALLANFPGRRWLRDRFWYKYRFFLWDRLLIFKRLPGEGADAWLELPSPLAEIAGWDGGPPALP